ncbi:nucleotide disphospho-sugar-binding domain-containing protein [Deinococcus sp. A31D244]|uniref:glycosyltransferase n=1 Tax=Deinococcus sp. A31D244 TaxID=3397675 RepID=UPI0039E10325
MEHYHWPASVQLTGYWFLPERVWTPPAGLEDFLAAGPPPVSIGFGSMGLRDPAQTTALILAALDHAGLRAVLLSDWGGLGEADLPSHMYAAPPLPHSWLFSRVAAAVHHGGAGTTTASLRAGIPTIITPFFGDEGLSVTVGCSIGTSVFPQDGATADELLRHADLAMYEVKRTGKNATRFFTAALNDTTRARL